MEEQLPFVVCGSWREETDFPDNVRGECSLCGADLMHRPHIPKPSQLICLQCFAEIYDPDQMPIKVTRQTLSELEILKKRHMQ